MKVSFVIPLYNESATLKEAIGRIVAVDLDKELVIVDDGSTDGSRELVTALANDGFDGWLTNPGLKRGHNEVRVHLQPQNMGKGAVIPMADVPDFFWKHGSQGYSRAMEGPNHFADMDQPRPGDGVDLLTLCQDTQQIDANVWNTFYDSVKDLLNDMEKIEIDFY